MKVTISCIGKFHAFNLAEQLNQRGYLYKLITTFFSRKRGLFPESRKDAERIDPNKVVTNIFPAFIGTGLSRLPIIGVVDNWHYYGAEMFDKWASKQIGECDLVVAWADTALHTLRSAKKYGAKTILERGSSHIIFQNELLIREYEKYGIKVGPVDKRLIDKELIEYNEADYISVPSTYAKESYIQNGIKPEKIIQVPYGVNLSHFRSIAKNDSVFRVIFVGTLSVRKGIHYLLEAFSELKLKNAELLLVGPLSYEIKPFLKKYEGGYRYIGKVPHLELYKYFSSSSVFVLPSVDEGLALVILQAMACGLPVICSTNTGALDIVRNGVDGFIIPIRNVEAIQEKLLLLYKNQDLLAMMGRSALERVSSGFTWDDYGNKITDCYKRLLKV